MIIIMVHSSMQAHSRQLHYEGGTTIVCGGNASVPCANDVLPACKTVLCSQNRVMMSFILQQDAKVSTCGHVPLMQVPTVRCTLLKRTDWQDIAEQQQRTAFHPQSMVGLGRLEAFINSLDMPDDQQLAGLDAYDAEVFHVLLGC